MITICRPTASQDITMKSKNGSKWDANLINDCFTSSMYNGAALKIFKESAHKELQKLMKANNIYNNNWYFDISVRFDKFANYKKSRFKDKNSSMTNLDIEYLTNMFSGCSRQSFEKKIKGNMLMASKCVYHNLPKGVLTSPKFHVKSGYHEYFMPHLNHNEKRHTTIIDKTNVRRKDFGIEVKIKVYARDYSSQEFKSEHKVMSFTYYYMDKIDQLQ